MTTKGEPSTDPAPGAGAPTDPPATDPVAPDSGAPTDDPESEDPSDGAHAGADDDGHDEDDNPKSEAAKKGHETRQRRAKRRADLAKDADVKILLEAARKDAETKAKEAAAAEARKASMSELDRAVTEAEEAKAKLAAVENDLKGAQLEQAYNDAMIESELKIRPKSRKIMRGLVQEAMDADPTLTMGDALLVIAEDHDYLLQPVAAASAAPGQSAPQPKRPGATNAPAPRRETATPTTPEPPKPPDVTKMSKQEFREYARQKHGINPMH